MSNYKNMYLILGASSDVGFALLEQLDAEQSDSLFLLQYNTAANKMTGLVLHNGNSCVCIQADLSCAASVEHMIATIQEHCDAPTHIVHLAAQPFCYMKLKEFERDDFMRQLDIQITSFIAVLQTFLPVMAKRKAHNKIVMVISSVVQAVPKYMLTYTIVKHALLGLMRSLAADYTGKYLNINAVSPSMIQTQFLQHVDERMVQLLTEKSPEQRLATVHDIVPVLQFLLSEKANYIHGENIVVANGGTIA